MSVNKVILIGNVGKDPEVKYFDNGAAVANFTMATTERGYTAANGTQVPERTDWHNIVLWRGLAEIAEKYVRKGSKVYIEGKIKTRSYDAADGSKRYVTEIWGDNMELLTPRSQEQGQSASSYEAPAERPKQNSGFTPPASTPSQASSNPVIEEETDDLPF
ncbi:single-stranded DNA-binding protein [Bacteroidales bacterium OttesenSCG-928-I14]|nr:single-stranded DNA-binding protein [Bacteroidales bacterium OttesenSCG-928-I14]